MRIFFNLNLSWLKTLKLIFKTKNDRFRPRIFLLTAHINPNSPVLQVSQSCCGLFVQIPSVSFPRLTPVNGNPGSLSNDGLGIPDHSPVLHSRVQERRVLVRANIEGIANNFKPLQNIRLDVQSRLPEISDHLLDKLRTSKCPQSTAGNLPESLRTQMSNPQSPSSATENSETLQNGIFITKFV